MSQARITLDNPGFQGTLRYKRRSVAYEPRPVHIRTIQDVVAVQNARAEQSKSLHTLQQPVHTPGYMDVMPKPVHHVRRRAPQAAETIQPRQATSAPSRRRKIRLKRFMSKQAFLYAGAFVVFSLGMYASLSGLWANKQVGLQVKTLQKSAVQGAATGSSDGTTPPSMEKPNEHAVRSYAVSPLNPRYIDIPKLKVHARVLAMGVDRKNELQAPYGIYDAGWYNASAKPGENGAMLVDGHSGIGKTRGIFHDLTKLVAGDEIVIKRGDGQVFTYLVTASYVADADKVDMASLMVSADTAKPGINLITCAGDQIPGTFTLKQRVVVRAVMK